MSTIDRFRKADHNDYYRRTKVSESIENNFPSEGVRAVQRSLAPNTTATPSLIGELFGTNHSQQGTSVALFFPYKGYRKEGNALFSSSLIPSLEKLLTEASCEKSEEKGVFSRTPHSALNTLFSLRDLISEVKRRLLQFIAC